MKKLLTMTVVFCTMITCSIACASAKVIGARWGVDKDNVLRLVVDITDDVKYEIKKSDSNKLNLIVEASADSNLYKTSPIRSSLANSMRVYNEGNNTILELTLTKQIADKDYKSFMLRKDPINSRPQRIVMDVTADKKEPIVTPSIISTSNAKTPVIVSTKPTGKRPPIIKYPVKSAPEANDTNTKAIEVPKTELPKANVPVGDTSKVELPKSTAPKVEETKKATTKADDIKTSDKKVEKKSNLKVITNSNKKDKATAPKKEIGLPAIKATRKYTVGGGIKGKIIVLDAGHGGSDPGAIGASGLKEKEVTLAITKLLKQELEDKGAKVYMTRTTDVDVYKLGASDRDELQARVNVAEKNNCDAFISIHIDSATNKTVGGISTHYYPKTDYDVKLARNIQNNLAKSFKVNDRGTREAGFYVIKRSSMPAVLCEMLFISNKKEEALLQSTWFRKKSARVIAEGVENYFK